MTLNSTQGSKPSRLWQNLLKAGVSLALLALLISTTDLGHTWDALRNIDPPLFVVALLLYHAGIAIRGGRWGTLVAALGCQPGLRRLTGLYYVGMFFGTMLPTGFGGDVVKAYELSQDMGNAADAAGTVLIDRWLGLLVLFIQALLVLPFNLKLVPRPTALAVGGLGAGAVIATALLFEPAWQRGLVSRLPGVLGRLGNKWLAISETAVHGYGRRSLAQALLYSLAFNLVHVINHWVIGLALGVHISIGYYFLFVPLISLSLTLPISISGLGVREGAFVALFRLAGVAQPQAFAIGITVFVLQLTSAIVGGAIYATQGLQATINQRP
jgi:uncharacterized membrane protein YbhN (UPF0104 family)